MAQVGQWRPRTRRLWFFAGVGVLLLLLTTRAENAIPAKPARFFNDYAGVISKSTAEALNTRLEAFERETSNQVLVAIFKSIPDGYALEDFTQRTAEAWGVGKKASNNGVVLFVFTEARKMRIEVGYGLEGALPDALAKQIIDDEILPAFRAGDLDAGLTRGVDAILKATRGEYRGSGRARTRNQPGNSLWILAVVLLVLGWRIFTAARSARRGAFYGPRGRRYVPAAAWPFLSGGSGWGGGGGGSSGGGGGGFSGGGGSFGGGGASGSW